MILYDLDNIGYIYVDYTLLCVVVMVMLGIDGIMMLFSRLSW